MYDAKYRCRMYSSFHAGFPLREFDSGQASTNSLKDDPGTPEECNLFVGDLARNLTEEKLEKAFQHHGRVSNSALLSFGDGGQP